ncbi:MAG: type II toxin-antitoxin system HicA family toxin [Spirochaetales bacterium]|nr:type II toxin-antitoxin system HicA family toxin [Spirochaetales bacterium]
MHIDTCINTYYISFVKSWSSRDILKTLSADGWIVKHQVGSHVQLIHPTKPGKVTVPHPRKNLAPGTVRSIARQAGLDLEA